MTKKRPGRGVDVTGRSKGSARHVRLYHWMLRSEAWSALSLGARCTLIELYAHYDGQNNHIPMSARYAATRLGVDKKSANKWLHELEDRGFIRLQQLAGFGYNKRYSAAYSLTEFPVGTQPATKDFMRASAVAEIQNSVRRNGTECPTQRDTGAVAATICPEKWDGSGQLRRCTRTKISYADSLPSDPRRNSGNTRNTATPATDHAMIREAVGQRLAADGPGAHARLAQHLGITKPQLSHFMAGRRGLDPDTLEKLHNYAGGAVAILAVRSSGGSK